MRIVQSKHLKEKPTNHLLNKFLLMAQIRYRPNRFWQDEKTICVPQVRLLKQRLHYLYAYHHS